MMFPADVYNDRRKRLKKNFKSDILLFLGNDQSPMNYPDNAYAFRQDSSFLYFWGIDLAGLTAIIDIEQDREIIFGIDLTVAEMVWTGFQPALKELGLQSGVKETGSPDQLDGFLTKAIRKGRRIHFLPQYRPENLIKIQRLLGFDAAVCNQQASIAFIKAVLAQRSVKSEEEIRQIEAAVDVTREMQLLAMKISRPGMCEKEAVGAMVGLAYALSSAGPAFPIIFTTQGHILHNPRHGNIMRAGDLVINDCGWQSALGYASDITRTFPVGGKFSAQQEQIYRIVLAAQRKAIETIRPGIEYREVHLTVARQMATGLKTLGLMKGDLDEAVAAGAHALFFPCGLGHMLGLDVHDMEDLGEDHVGYTDTILRNPQFGICYLRLAKTLAPGFVITVEPGLYFIPALMDQWKAQKKFEAFIDYDKLEDFRGFGGVRIEDDVLVVAGGRRVLGQPIAKTVEEVTDLCS
jgi:Xaa-Pro aminopeptidase